MVFTIINIDDPSFRQGAAKGHPSPRLGVFVGGAVTGPEDAVHLLDLEEIAGWGPNTSGERGKNHGKIGRAHV